MIQQVLAVFRPGQSFIKTVVAFGTLARVIEDLINEETLDLMMFTKMFDANKYARDQERKKKPDPPIDTRKRGRSRSAEHNDHGSRMPQHGPLQKIKKQERSAKGKRKEEKIEKTIALDSPCSESEMSKSDPERDYRADDAFYDDTKEDYGALDPRSPIARASSDPERDVYLAEDDKRHSDSEDSSQHPCPPSSQWALTAENKALPKKCDWADLSGGDTDKGFLHDDQREERRVSSSPSNRRIRNRARPRIDEVTRNERRSPSPKT